MPVNVVVLTGRLTRNPDLHQNENRVKVASFTLAVDRRKKDAGADFIRCCAFDKTAEIVSQYLYMGDPVTVQGRLQTRSYENAEKRHVTVTEVICDTVILPPKTRDKNPAVVGDKDSDFIEVTEGELPF